MNVQASAFSSAEALTCVINIALVPEPWRDWLAVRRDGDQRSIGYNSGIFWNRLNPTEAPAGVDAWWQVTDAADAAAAAADMIVQLRERGLPLLVRLLDRSRLLQAVRNQEIGVFDGGLPGYEGQVEAALLADQGPSRRLDELLVSIKHQASASQAADSGAFEAWARTRANRTAATQH